MKEAGRALAIDPTLNAAAHIVGRLMLEPPTTAPPEVANALADDAIVLGMRHARVQLIGSVGYVLACVGLLFSGVREPTYIWALLGATTLSMATVALTMRWVQNPVRYASIVGINAIQVGLVSRMFSPVLAAPGIATITAMALLANPLIGSRRISTAVSLLASVLVPVGGRASGLDLLDLPVRGRHARHRRPGCPVTIDPVVMLVVYTTVLVVGATMMARTHSTLEEDARTKLHIQRWRQSHLLESTR